MGHHRGVPPEQVEEFAVHRPSGALAGVAPMICGYRELGLAPGVHRGLPSPYLTLIITLDEPCTVAIHPDPRQPGDSYPALVGGLHVRPALVTHDGAQSGVQVALNPLAARAVLGVPAGELVMRDLHLDQLIGAAAHRLREQLGAAAGWPERFAIVEGFLRDRIAGGAGAGAAAGGSVRREVRGVWSRVIAQRGVVRIDELARAAGWSSRHLGEQFRRELGLSPKTAARVVRFDAARRRLPHTVATGGGVAELACASGYADQAHLTRDFREFAGLAPRAWWAAEFRNLQSGTGSDGAASGHALDVWREDHVDL